ncbi:MFS transporter [Cloacibacillus evryensis]|uniref:MFS transporter n=1 Tax=Cloacibacillus evryensis TaxID=508460 RepID=UPI0004B91FF1|nr:MFS transporter [Cloacibacillus evryensis]
MFLTEKAASMSGTVFASLKHRDFRIFWIGQCVSLMGTWMQRTALVWLVYTITNSPFKVGLVGVAQYLPILLFTLFSGAIVDRFSKRRLLIVTQSLLMLQALALALLTFFHCEQYWLLLLLCTALGLTTTVDMPARLSFFMDLVGKEDIMNAVSLNSTIVNLARIIGPAAAGIVMELGGASVCFFINAVSFLAVIFSLTRIKTVEKPSFPRTQNVVADVKEGLDYIRGSETLVINVIFLAVLCTFAMNSDVIIPVFARTVLGMGAGAYTRLLSAVGLGSLIGAVVMAGLARYGVRKWFLPAAAAGETIILIAMGLCRSYGLVLVMVTLLGILNLMFLNSGNSIFQLYAPEKYRGRVMSVYALITVGSTTFGNFYAGVVMQAFGGWAGWPFCGIAAGLSLWLLLRKKRAVLESWFKQSA